MSKKKDLQLSLLETEPIIDNKTIQQTLESNYMPYAMSVIISRALPEIDGFKPSHRKLLYTMYKMGLLTGNKTKSANIVGQTMRYNPHGDSAIYETMVRLSRGNESLLCPYVDSKGNFGKHYSREMSYAASRYTEAKLSSICKEIFKGLDKDAVDFVDNYDNTLKEPLLLPVPFPSILVNSPTGIAVGMASNFCSFNLKEVCEASILRIKKPHENLLSVMPAPDFSTGGEIVYDQSEMEQIYNTGKGSFKVRGKYRVDKKTGVIEIYEIPYSTTVENIIEQISVLVKNNKIKDINATRDETDLNGLKIAIDYKKSADPDELMKKLFALTKLQDSFPCNFNILINGKPRVLGIPQIIDEWTVWRRSCLSRELTYTLSEKEHKLMLLEGLAKIVLDIDKTVRIIRTTEKESDVVPNLEKAFKINEEQAEYIAEIKLRNINKEYLLNRIKDKNNLEKEIASLKATLESKTKINNLIIKDLEYISENYGSERKSTIIKAENIESCDISVQTPNYPVKIYCSNENYFKKIDLNSKISGEYKLKEGDLITTEFNCENKDDLLFFSNKQIVYKMKVSDISDGKITDIGDYLQNMLGLQNDEKIIKIFSTFDYSETILIAFTNGKVAKFPINVYQTKTNRKKLINAFSDTSDVVNIVKETKDSQYSLYSSDQKALSFNSSQLTLKTTKSSQGVQVFTLSKKAIVTEMKIADSSVMKCKSIPSTGKKIV